MMLYKKHLEEQKQQTNAAGPAHHYFQPDLTGIIFLRLWNSGG